MVTPGNNLTQKALIVIPSYNEAERLPIVLSAIRRRLAAESEDGYSVRYLVVDDGSVPEQSRQMQALISESGLASRVGIVRLRSNAGKGAAICAGFSEGLREKFDFLGFMDADGSVAVADIYRALEYLNEPEHAALAGVIGSRIQMLGRRVNRSLIRHYLGRTFASFVSVLFSVPVYDTQCGLKIFRAGPLQRYLSVPLDRRWVWDTELLMAMLRSGEAIHELPVDWHSVRGSKVSFLRDPIVMAARLVRFRWVMDSRIEDHGPQRNRSYRDVSRDALVLQD